MQTPRGSGLKKIEHFANPSRVRKVAQDGHPLCRSKRRIEAPSLVYTFDLSKIILPSEEFRARSQPPRLLIYVPMAQGDTHDALIELEAGGVVMRPGQQPPNRNTKLAIIARNALKPILGDYDQVKSAIDTIAFHCVGYWPWCSSTIRTARSRSSAGYLPPRPTVMAPSSQGLEPPDYPA